jgi:murein DD-endopeptidase MepM/ murein hydrolase activator NlpD
VAFSLVVLPIAKSEGGEVLNSRNIDSNSQNLKLLRSEMSGNLTGATGGGEILIEENAILASSTTSGNEEKPKIVKSGADEISVYIVREGDTLSQIAEMFGVKVSTVRGFNNIRTDKDLKPGQELLILPIDGAVYKVEKGDTLSSVAKKFNSDEFDISVFNDIGEDGKLTVGSEIVIPNAEALPEPEPTKKPTTKVAVTASTKTAAPKSTGATGNSYPAGFYTHPVPRGSVKSQGFHGPFQAQDLAAKEGTAIVASSGGRVVSVKNGGYNGGYGTMIIIDDGRANVLYAHLSAVSVTQGQTVEQGEEIGKVGNTGRSTGPHLHIEYRGKKGPMKTPVW